MAILTKSKYMTGRQCLKHLWISVNDPKSIPDTSSAVKERFDQGNLIEKYARSLYSNGEHVPTENFDASIEKTKELIDARKPIFEAGIEADYGNDKIYARADILNPVGDNEWDIIEIKSSTKVDDENIHDVSFQKHVYEKAGLKIRNCYILHVNNEYVRDGKLEYEKLVKEDDITTEVNGVSGIEDRINEMFDVIHTGSLEGLDKKYIDDDGKLLLHVGRHCNVPDKCRIPVCWDVLPKYNVFHLTSRSTRKTWPNRMDLFKKGIVDMAKIPQSWVLEENQQIQKSAVINAEAYFKKEMIKEFLDELKYPLYYLDFETMSLIIPYDGSKPYQQTPFQYSLHVVQEDGSTEHFEYLAEGKDDPRPKLFMELSKVLGDKGDIITYNVSFERGVINNAIKYMPPDRDGIIKGPNGESKEDFLNMWVEQTVGRLKDVGDPFKKYHYYHPDQKGSWSIKKVLPALTGKGYSEMNIGKGDDASALFVYSIFGDASSKEVAKIRSDLLKYCKLDTEGMIWIVDALKELV
jgi:hypothetical protein